VAVERDTLRQVLQELAPEAQDFLSGAIRFPSIHGGEADLQQFVKERWESAGVEISEHAISNDLKEDAEYTTPAEDRDFTGRPNLVARLKSRGPGRSLILNSHVDVVPADDWPDAFTPRIEGDTMFGRGACDAKGCVATMYLAALALQKLGLPGAGEVICQIVIDEEVGGNGTLALIREGLRADGVVVLEPTGLAMHPANRGAIWYRFEFEGRSCHMGRKHEGVNAIELACETMRILYEYEKELIRDQDEQPLFAHYDFPAQVNVGILRGGHFPSAVAGEAVLEGGVGFLPNRPMAQVKADIVRYIDKLGSQRLKERYTLSFPKLHNDSYETPVDDPLVQTFNADNRETDALDSITGWNVSCDARLFARVGGMPTVVFGPGRIDDAHSANEQIHLPDMVTAAETLVRFVERWCTDSA